MVVLPIPPNHWEERLGTDRRNGLGLPVIEWTAASSIRLRLAPDSRADLGGEGAFGARISPIISANIPQKRCRRIAQRDWASPTLAWSEHKPAGP